MEVDQQQQPLLAIQAFTNAKRIMLKITSIHGSAFDFPYQDSKVVEFTEQNHTTFSSLANLSEDQILKLEDDIEKAKSILSGSEFCQTLKQICFYFNGICQEIEVGENKKKLQKQLKIALKLLSNAAGKNKDLEEIYRFWCIQELARRLRRTLQNKVYAQIFFSLFMGGISTMIARFFMGSMADFSSLKIDWPPYVWAVAGFLVVVVIASCLGYATMSSIDLVADSNTFLGK